jgi:hypothetical protein
MTPKELKEASQARINELYSVKDKIDNLEATVNEKAHVEENGLSLGLRKEIIKSITARKRIQEIVVNIVKSRHALELAAVESKPSTALHYLKKEDLSESELAEVTAFYITALGKDITSKNKEIENMIGVTDGDV